MEGDNGTHAKSIISTIAKVLTTTLINGTIVTLTANDTEDTKFHISTKSRHADDNGCSLLR